MKSAFALAPSRGVCEYAIVSRRHLLVYLICIAMSVMGMSGVHGHFTTDVDGLQAPAHDDHWQQDTLVRLLSHHSSDHAERHTSGDVDVDLVTKWLGKPVTLVALALLSIFVGAAFLSGMVSRRLRISLTSPRPPKSRSSPFLEPPSHAPPVAA